MSGGAGVSFVWGGRTRLRGVEGAQSALWPRPACRARRARCAPERESNMAVNPEKETRLGESEYRFACIVWEHEPLPSGKLVELCAKQLGWKKSTTYTVLKNLCGKGILCNEHSVVRALVPKEQVQRQESAQVVERAFDGSLPRFVAAFLGQKGIRPEEAEEIEAMLAAYKAKGGDGEC